MQKYGQLGQTKVWDYWQSKKNKEKEVVKGEVRQKISQCRKQHSGYRV